MTAKEIRSWAIGIVIPVLAVAGFAFTFHFLEGAADLRGRIALGVTTGLLTASIMFWVGRLTPSPLPEMAENTAEILSVQRKIDAALAMGVSVEALQRQALGPGYYQQMYREADSLDIFGISLGSLVESLEEAKSCEHLGLLPDGHLLRVLASRDVSVRAVLVHPESDFARQRDAVEGSTITNIRKNLKRLEDLSKHLELASEKGTPKMLLGKIEIHACRGPKIPFFSIFRAEPSPFAQESVLLGLIPASERGVLAPTLSVHRRNGDGARATARVIELCRTEFEAVYSETNSAVFSWHGREARFHAV